jgi:hypothetical protein
MPFTEVGGSPLYCVTNIQALKGSEVQQFINCHLLPYVQIHVSALLYETKGLQIFQKSRCHLKILGARRAMRRKFHTENPQILGATVQNLVARATWPPGLVYSCTRPFP